MHHFLAALAFSVLGRLWFRIYVYFYRGGLLSRIGEKIENVKLTSTVMHSLDSISNLNSQSTPNVISSDFGGIVILFEFYLISQKKLLLNRRTTISAHVNLLLFFFQMSTQL